MDETIATEIKNPELVVGTPMTPPPGSLTTDSADMERTWDRVIQGIIYALTFLLPLLFTTWTFEPLEFSKQILLFVLASAAVIAWLLKLLVLRRIQFVKTVLDLPIGIFLLIYLLASIFSVDRVASFLGFYGSFHGNFFQVLFLIVFYYLVVNNFRTLAEIKRLAGVFLFSVFLAMLYVILQFFGLFLIRWPTTAVTSFNTIGGLLMISLYSGFAVVMSLGLMGKSWFNWQDGRLWRIITIVSAFIVLLTVNFTYAWAGLLVGILVYMVFQMGLAKSFSMKTLIAPLVMLIIVVAFMLSQAVFQVTPFRSLFSFNLPSEVRLDYQTANPVLVGAVAEKPILGSGPNTFLYAFSKHKSPDFNLSPFWNVRFDQAPSEAAEYLVGSGILGLLAFETLTIIFMVYAVLFLIRRKEEESWGLALALFASFAVLWFAHWFFFFNTVVAFSLWFVIAAFMAITRVVGGEQVKISGFSFATSPRQTVSAVSVVSLSLVLLVVFLFFALAIYASDVYYVRGLHAATKPQLYDQAQRDFEQTIRLNRFRPDYYLAYGEFLFLRVNQELTKSKPNLSLVRQWLAASINTARVAVALSPSNWTGWERLANLYTFARPLVAGVDQFTIDSLTKAAENDQHNPILFTELGQVYRASATKIDPGILGTGPDADNDGLSDEQEATLGCDPRNPSTAGDGVLDGTKVLSGLNCNGTGLLPNAFVAKYVKTDAGKLVKAEDAFKQAMKLKPDYAAPYYQLALTYEQENRPDLAITTLEQIVQQYPTNTDLKFELGRLYFNAGKVQNAQVQFLQLVQLIPNNSNALFSLALSYERLGQIQSALIYYQKVLLINPANQDIKNKVLQLQQQLGTQPLNKTK
jgi:tetratricopeptide (TPR) repeat protein